MSASSSKRAIVWFRQDLRLTEQDAVSWVIEQGWEIIPVFLWVAEEESPWKPGGATQWWLHHALADLDHQLREKGSKLILRSAADSLSGLQKLIKETGAQAVCWNRRYEPGIVARDTKIKAILKDQGIEAKSFGSSLLFHPSEISNKAGSPFKVFTPFWKHLIKFELPNKKQTDLSHLSSPEKWPNSEALESFDLLPNIKWDTGIQNFWNPTREGALIRLKDFGSTHAIPYDDQRDLPAVDGTSQLSPFLHFGQIGPRETLHRLRELSNEHPKVETGILRQLYWREFAHHLLFHFPETDTRPLRPEYAAFPWQEDPQFLRAWQLGETGYPIVDAGMRQLWQTGWMHNRVRMIVASFLVKHLLQHWSEGAKWFWDTLVDADLANNTFGWQWVAGCGADASPYFRIFNPITQGEKFDPTGAYVRKYVPELSELPNKYLNRPWELGQLDLLSFDVTLGKNYPAPIIEHSVGRQRALDALAKFKTLKNSE